MRTSPTESTAARAQCFATTDWSEVLAAREDDSSRQAAALERLCRTYWYPLYAFLRREGRTPHDAQDLTQEFFARLLRGNFLENVGPHKGKFRSFLLAALRHFLCDQWDKAKAEKRGGGQALISLDECDPEERYQFEPAAGTTAEQLYERRWALTVLAQALAQLKEELATPQKLHEFEELKIFLSSPTGDGAYETAAGKLGLAAQTVAVKVHRLRQRYAELIRAEIAQTVASPADVEQELQDLFNAVGR